MGELDKIGKQLKQIDKMISEKESDRKSLA